MIKHISNVREVSELCKHTQSFENLNRMEDATLNKIYITNHTAAPFKQPSGHYGMHRLFSADLGLNDFCQVDN